MSKVELYCGDCLGIMRSISNESIDLTVTSPPYDNLRTYNGNINQWNFDKFKLVAKELYRVTKTGGTVVWIVSDATIDGNETGTSFRQALYFKETGFKLNDTMIWSKPSFTAVGALKKRYAQTFEYMFIFSKETNRVFNAIKDRRTKSRHKDYHGKIRQKDGSMKPMCSLGKQYGEYGIRYNVWNMSACVSNKERTGHPAQFPEQLVNDHIISWSNQGDTIFDPLMGSGTTGKMAVLNNRNFIGIELDSNYFEIAKKRIEEAQNESTL